MPEQTTDEMKSRDTLKQNPDFDSVLKAIADLGKSLNQRIDSLEKNTDIQFEAIRQGIVANSAAFDRLEATVYNSRSDVANLRADIKEMGEYIRRSARETV
jgi:hypothetical protein